jgi:hypothetical protein
VVPHGVPTIVRAAGELRSEVVAPTLGYALRPAIADLVHDLDGSRLLATLGAISPDKGLETAITALPDVVAVYPDVRYLIAGSTHPEVARREGESYRMSLQRLVASLGLADHVRFLDAHLTTGEVAALLGRTEVYLTPYRSRAQASSGALTYAVAAGCPVVSTDFHYAEELLGGGAGITVPCNDPDAFGAAVVGLLGDPARLAAARAAADRMAAGLTWPAVAQQHEALLRTAIAEPGAGGRRLAVPQVRLDQLAKLTDEIGILHAARGYEPDTESGYRGDDVARSAIVGTELLSVPAAILPARAAATALDWITGALRFLQAASAPNGMRRRMAYSGVWEDEPYLGDHIGRSIWALGAVAAGPGVPGQLRGRAESLRDELAPLVGRLAGLRATAYAVLGLARGGLSPATEAALAAAAARLDRAWQGGDATWRWFEHTLGIDSARLAQAMIAAGHGLGENAMVERGLRSLEWYLRQVGLDDEHGVLRAPAVRWRYPDESAPPGTGDERPADAAATVEALVEAYTVTGSGRFGRLARRAFEWFLGVNTFEIQMYDPTSGGCHDSVGPTWVDPNQGAEATLAYYQALLALANSDLVTLTGATTRPAGLAGGVEALARHLPDPH